MNPKSILTAILFVLTPVLGLAQSVISINIAGGNANSPSGGGGGGQGIVTGNAGLGQLGNWNNAIGASNVGAGLTVPALVNSTGAATGASFSWVTNNTWSTSSANGAGGDQDMLSGYLDNLHANGSITVAGLGSEFTNFGYNVLVYYQTDNSNMTAGFTVADNAGNTDTRFGHQVAVNNWPLAGGIDGYIISTETANNTLFSANVVQLSGFSGSDFTMTGNGGAVGSARARPSGIQIISLGGAVDDDGDGDGLPNAWEIQHNLDPNDNGDVDPVNGAAGDPDADTLSNLDEFNRGTDPRDDDSDDDNLGDAVEGNTGTYVSPTQTGSDPLDPDSDGDTLEDGAEVEANPFVTDPNNADTDGDGLDDASEEAANPFLTDPTKEDTDGDGFSDSAEINLGSDPTDENDAPIGVERGLTISINIAGGNANSPSGGGGGGQGIVTGNAGLGQLGNWNNAVGSSNVGDGLTVPALVSSTGSATAASFSWVTNNTWSTSSADGAGGDQDMLSGYIDNFHANGSITVAGLGTEFTGPGYNVLVYYQTDNSGMTAGFTVADNAGNTDTRYGHQVAVNNWPLAGGELTDGYIISTETANNTLFSANIVQLSGFSGSDFTMTGNGGAVGSARARPSGIQIISLGGAVDDDGDGDGLPNAWEIQHNLDPNDNGDVDPVNGAAGDPDADTLSNLDEFNRGTDPRDDDSDDDNLGDAVEGNTGTYVSPTQTGSDPLDPDSDGDTLEDGAEVEANPFVTDPNNADTDGDGLDDASEEAANPFLTDPTKEDTDGDGFSDSAEINLGSDPTDPNDFPNDVPNVGGGGLTISINIAGGNANSPSAGGAGGQGIVTGNAGLGQLGNWNNAVGSSNVGDGLTVPALVSSTGSATAASFSWVTNNTWSTSSADGAGTDQDMLSGYIDNFHANGSITVAGLGTEFTGPGYNVLVYYQTDNSGMTAGFTVADNAGNTDTRYGHQVAVNNWPLAGGELTDGYIISTEAEGNTLFSANIVQLSGFSGSDFTMTGNGGSVGSARARPSGIQIISLGGAEPLPLEVSGRDMLTFRWPSQRGQLYTLRSETDPSVADPIDWPVFDGHQDMEATPPENTLTIPRPPEAKHFFVIEGFAAPPESIFADDFESGQGGWTTGTEGAVGTMWELGLPGVGPAAANSPTSCFGTNLTAGYAIDADVWLRSPPIDLTAVAGATVNYFQAFDIEETFDLGRVSVIDCADDSVLAVIEADLDGASLDWALVSRALPQQALGKIVKIEFRLITDVFDGSVFAGWYLDDFMVTVP